MPPSRIAPLQPALSDAGGAGDVRGVPRPGYPISAAQRFLSLRLCPSAPGGAKAACPLLSHGQSVDFRRGRSGHEAGRRHRLDNELGVPNHCGLRLFSPDRPFAQHAADLEGLAASSMVEARGSEQPQVDCLCPPGAGAAPTILPPLIHMRRDPPLVEVGESRQPSSHRSPAVRPPPCWPSPAPRSSRRESPSPPPRSSRIQRSAKAAMVVPTRTSGRNSSIAARPSLAALNVRSRPVLHRGSSPCPMASPAIRSPRGDASARKPRSGVATWRRP